MGDKKFSSKGIKPLTLDDKFKFDVDISKEGFAANFAEAIRVALEFTRTLIVNELPDKPAFLVNLCSSHDDNLQESEYVYEEDRVKEVTTYFDACEVVNLLWRDGFIPVWINIFVDSEDGEHTYLRMDCSGRFSKDPKLIYHAHEGRAPFHVLGPPRPPELGIGDRSKKFDLYWNRKDKD